MKLIPMRNKVLVIKDEPEKEIRGLIVPDVAQKEYRVKFGKVVKLGPTEHENPLKVGDRVVVPAWEKGHAVVVDDVKHVLFDLDEVEAIVEE